VRSVWVVGCGLWVVGCGLWVVGCGLWVGEGGGRHKQIVSHDINYIVSCPQGIDPGTAQALDLSLSVCVCVCVFRPHL
jgi:hypothetical protein